MVPYQILIYGNWILGEISKKSWFRNAILLQVAIMATYYFTFFLNLLFRSCLIRFSDRGLVHQVRSFWFWTPCWKEKATSSLKTFIKQTQTVESINGGCACFLVVEAISCVFDVHTRIKTESCPGPPQSPIVSPSLLAPLLNNLRSLCKNNFFYSPK